MLVPVLYYIFIIFWLPRGFRERLQYAIGCLCYILGGPFINIAVLFYSVYYVDSFGWGKTRKVAAEQPTNLQVTVPVDEEREIGLRSTVGPEQDAYDTVAILGANVYSTHLLKAFGVHHKVIYFDSSVDALEQTRGNLSDSESSIAKITSDENDLAKATVYLIAAPLLQVPYAGRKGPLDLLQAVDIVSHHLQPRDIVMIETTVSIGSTRSILEHTSNCGAIGGYSPPPSADLTKRALTDSNKVISAINDNCSHRIERLYRLTFSQVVNLGSPEAAEMYNLLENTLHSSRTMITNGYEGPLSPVRLQSNFQRLLLMWKEFMLEAETGLGKMSSTPEDASSGTDSSVVNGGKQAIKEAISELPEPTRALVV